jgi:hypothetical protein
LRMMRWYLGFEEEAGFSDMSTDDAPKSPSLAKTKAVWSAVKARAGFPGACPVSWGVFPKRAAVTCAEGLWRDTLGPWLQTGFNRFWK